ncbi:methyltransferase-like 26 [Ylistrum balloti]|uniref:methyltransferase-like 26 n=1 Tax=Ylistrum balloti TaxID=509963 RepID=UPI002905D34F|nr:methyltransferase-like 26 [Ylistrum balloti]
MLTRVFSTARTGLEKMLQFPAAERNKGPILEVLQQALPHDTEGLALEVASGSGAHVTHFAQHFPHITWLPSEIEDRNLKSISAFTQHAKVSNVKEPVLLDVTTDPKGWGGGLGQASLKVILNANMIHISPWETALGLFVGANYLLQPGGYLFLYGPFAVHGSLTPESNVKFDQYLRSQDCRWGVRDVDDVEKLAKTNRLKIHKIVDMPANNKMLIFLKES